MENIDKCMVAVVAMTALSAFAAVERPMVSFYVAPSGDDAAEGSAARPVKTVARAVELSRAVMSDARREIVVADGVYRLEKPIELDGRDTDLTIRAEHRGKAVVSGAVPVTGWREDEQNPQLLTAPLPFATEPKTQYALTVGGDAATLSSYPRLTDGGGIPYRANAADQNFTVLEYDPAKLPEGFDMAGVDLESAQVVIPQEWVSNVSGILTNDVANGRIVLAKKTSMPLGQYNTGFKLVNTRAGLDEPGTWMYEPSAGRIVYSPRAGETAANLRATLTGLPCLFALRGVSGAAIDGLVLEGCMVAAKSGNLRNGLPFAAAVSVRNCTDFAVRHCEIRHCAGGGVVVLRSAAAEVSDCHVHHVGDSGIDVREESAGLKMLRNHVHHTGQTRPSSKGIFMMSSDVQCIGNRVHDLPGCGITLWGGFSVVASNDFSDAMLVSRDGAALYGGYDFSVVKDNYVHYTKDSHWSGLYADEGTQHAIFTGNRFEGMSWPTHMHQTYGIVVSNNTFTCDKPMRWSFLGGAESRFVDNKIYAPQDVTNDAYVANCREWARNEVFVKDGDGYRSAGVRTFVNRPASKASAPLVVPRIGEKEKGVPPKIDGDWHVKYTIHWKTLGRFGFLEDGTPYGGGQPACYLRPAYDDGWLYLHFSQKYPKLVPYPGMMNLNHVWGHGDAIRFYLGDTLEITAYFDGTVECNDPTVDLGPENFALFAGGWLKGKGLEFRLPASRFGVAPGKSVAFNAVCYSGDKKTMRWMFPPRPGDVRTGALTFATEDEAAQGKEAK